MKGQNHWKTVLMALFCTAMLSGCYRGSTQSLYALPKQPDEYYQLQNAIDRTLPGDAAYSGPLSGSNQQAVQLADLDGDGQDEAVVFVKTGEQKPLRVYIFDSNVEGGYDNTAVIEGDGSAFDAVDYVQLDGEPGLEILVGRRLSEEISQSLVAYSYQDGHLTELLSTNYTEFTSVDLDGDERRDVFVLRMDTNGRSGVAELYRYETGQMIRQPEASLSDGAQQIKRMVTGYVSPDVPAVFVACTYGQEDIVTDIFTCLDGEFRNIAANAETGLSAQTVRNYNVYAADIDHDDLVELPKPIALPSVAAGEDTYWVIDWYNLLPDGQQKIKMTTFHNYADGWYMVLPDRWRERLTVSRSRSSDHIRGYTFSRWNGRDNAAEEIFTVSAFTGSNRLQLAQQDGYFLLAEKGETAFAAKLSENQWAAELTQDDLIAMFHFVQVDWNSGEI